MDGLAHWSPENAVAARELVLAYHDVFTLESNELGCTSAIEHEIRIENDEPFKKWFRRIPLPLLEEVRTSLQDILEAGAIHPSQSPWCSTVILVWKKDGTLCFCVDFRRLNACMKKDSYPLPRIQEALESMVGSAHFSSMDFKLGFWQIAAVHSLHSGQPGILQVYPHAIWVVQCTHDVPASYAEHPGGAEPHILCDLLGQCHSLRSYGGGAPGVLVHGVREVPGVQFEDQAFEVLVLPVRNHVPCPSHLTEGHPT